MINRSIVFYLNEGAIKDYFNKVGEYVSGQHSNKLTKILDKHPEIRKHIPKKIPEFVKKGFNYKEHAPKIIKSAWKYSTPKQKNNLLGGATGKILKAVGTRLIGGPIGGIVSSISSQQMSKRPPVREEI
jgi:hypothetical protein